MTRSAPEDPPKNPRDNPRSNRLGDVFIDSALADGQAVAVEGPEREWTYREVLDGAASLARRIGPRESGEHDHFVGVCCGSTINAMTGHLGSLLAGRGFMPLTVGLPLHRMERMLERGGIRHAIVDESVLADAPRMAILERLVPDIVTAGPESPPTHASEDFDAIAGDPSPFAYLLFTSGSTGMPKGVPIRHENILEFLAHVRKRYGFNASDRFTQLFALTFDLSLFDQFACWDAGGTLCPPTGPEQFDLEAYLNRTRATVMFSVPSGIRLTRQAGRLGGGSAPDLRWGLFCGEPLLERDASSLSDAAPNATVENLYGPTEATLAITVHEYERENARRDGDIVPIGAVHEGHEWRLGGDETGTGGELQIHGPQVFAGYWGDQQASDAAFAHDEKGRAFYRTGDNVRLDEETGQILFIGRRDSQIKILGHRVELGEIEAVLTSISGADATIVIPIEDNDGQIMGLVGYLCRSERPLQEIKRLARLELPKFMIPRKMQEVDEFPMNSSGKIDRQQIATWPSRNGRIVSVPRNPRR
jgi:amino acid adenylation domain-containing protein